MFLVWKLSIIIIFPRLIYEFKIILIKITSEGRGLENGSKDHLEKLAGENSKEKLGSRGWGWGVEEMREA